MTDWISALHELALKGKPSVLLTVAGVRGSAPRETGAKMIVTAAETIGTIGGGQLEYECTRVAVNLMRDDAPGSLVRRFALGTNCGQCCGGIVNVMFEYVPAAGADWLNKLVELHRERKPAVMATALSGVKKILVTAESPGGQCPAEVLVTARTLLGGHAAAIVVDGFLLEPILHGSLNVAIFGAGHVGAATVDAMSRLDCEIRWIDSRRNVFPNVLPANVSSIESAQPALEVAALPKGTYFLVMTHSHPLDFDICCRILRRADAAYCGLIGSVSKRRRFEKLMRKEGMPEQLLNRLVCPVGVPGIAGKKPVEIAIAVTAEVLQTRDRCAAQQIRPVLLEARS
jgi:xanthine dehydrogenase accessory factor